MQRRACAANLVTNQFQRRTSCASRRPSPAYIPITPQGLARRGAAPRRDRQRRRRARRAAFATRRAPDDADVLHVPRSALLHGRLRLDARLAAGRVHPAGVRRPDRRRHTSSARARATATCRSAAATSCSTRASSCASRCRAPARRRRSSRDFGNLWNDPSYIFEHGLSLRADVGAGRPRADAGGAARLRLRHQRDAARATRTSARSTSRSGSSERRRDHGRAPPSRKGGDARRVHLARLVARLLRAGGAGDLVEVARLRAVLRDAAAVLEHDREVVAARGHSQVARALVEARRPSRRPSARRARTRASAPRRRTRRSVLHVARVLVERRRARLVLRHALPERVRRREPPAPVGRARVALALAHRHVGARPDRVRRS